MAKLASNHDCKQQTNVSEQEMLAQGELLGKAMQGMLKDAFAEAVVNAALGDGKEADINQNIHSKLQALLTGQASKEQTAAKEEAQVSKSEQVLEQALDPATAQEQEQAQAQEQDKSAQIAEIKKHLPNLELYTQVQLKAVKEHIEQCFGPIYLQVEDSQTDHIKCDIDIIKPSENQEGACQYLVTKGMGAHKMPVPDEFKALNLDRAELYLALASDWNLESEEEQENWPITLLSVLSRLPFVYDSWMAQGHIISFPQDEDYAPGTNYAGAILLNPAQDSSYGLELDNLGHINFYQVVLLYQEEIDYAEQYSARTLMKLMDKSAYVCSKDRALTKLRKPKHKVAL
ncbi:suppressor of fused domain protein [Anaerobiospirillum sp. NML120448]|uniref:suppressor of fused domain protein n=1 Tax=Anaerobiospirillum sp. NML120448 TaxID=2932816 RepID=UPI001FF48FB6|nr:suppressor of fused domain protein [Anaerobiospirillum sp. NML120448]MCK0514996.1 suppressor of fused domain protein [Anaerobiospirillum sp. NML120448]